MKRENILIRILKSLYVAQEVSNKGREKKLGRGFSTARRLNPYNPFSYIVVCLNIIVGILMFGFVGFWKELIKNPFKWD
jgi:hypothetical protein